MMLIRGYPHRNLFTSTERLIRKNAACLTTPDGDGNVLIHRIISSKKSKDAKLLIRARKGLEIKNKDGMFPTHLAVLRELDDVLVDLINAGVNLAAKCADGRTPLHMAVEKQSANMVDILVRAGAPLEATATIGGTPLHLAAGIGCVKVAQILLDAGSDIEAHGFGKTPLHLSVINERMEMIAFLLQRGANKEAESTLNDLYDHWASKTVLQMAVMTASETIVKLLLDYKTRANTASANDGRTPLHSIVEVAYDLDTPDNLVKQKTSLKRILSLLLDAKANLHERDFYGYTCLHYAIRLGCKEAFDILMEEIRKDVVAGNDHDYNWKGLLKAKDKLDSTPLSLSLNNAEEKTDVHVVTTLIRVQSVEEDFTLSENDAFDILTALLGSTNFKNLRAEGKTKQIGTFPGFLDLATKEFIKSVIHKGNEDEEDNSDDESCIHRLNNCSDKLCGIKEKLKKVKTMIKNIDEKDVCNRGNTFPNFKKMFEKVKDDDDDSEIEEKFSAYKRHDFYPFYLALKDYYTYYKRVKILRFMEDDEELEEKVASQCWEEVVIFENDGILRDKAAIAKMLGEMNYGGADRISTEEDSLLLALIKMETGRKLRALADAAKSDK